MAAAALESWALLATLGWGREPWRVLGLHVGPGTARGMARASLAVLPFPFHSGKWGWQGLRSLLRRCLPRATSGAVVLDRVS